MADVPERFKPENRISLAEMAARAAQRTASARPPPAPAPLLAPSDHPGFAAPQSQTRDAARSFAPLQPTGYPSNRAGGSGLIHLQSLQPVTQAAPLEQHVDFERMSAAGARRRAQLDSDPLESRGSRGLWIGFIVGLVVIAGAYGLALQRGINPLVAGRNVISSLRHWNGPPPANDAPVSKIEMPLPMAAAKPESPVARGLDPSRLPAAGANAPSEATDVVVDGKAVKAAAKASPRVIAESFAPKEVPQKAAPKPPEPKPEPAPVAQAAPPAPEPTGLAGAIKKAVGPAERAAEQSAATETAAPAMRGDIPETPPQGAIQGAIGSHRTAARACVDGYDAASRATIVFSSSGKVDSVSVAGPAAGTKAEACIVRALSKAAVGPFRRPTFSVTTTVTPP
jgi:hypothetical protein